MAEDLDKKGSAAGKAEPKAEGSPQDERPDPDPNKDEDLAYQIARGYYPDMPKPPSDPE